MQQDLSHSKHIKCLNGTINTHKPYNMYVPDRAQHKVKAGKEIILSLAIVHKPLTKAGHISLT